MNTFTLKVAALSLATVLNSYAADLTANVPVDFKATGVAAAAGTYRLAVQRPGIVIVKTDAGKNIAIAMLPVQTSSNPSKSTLKFSRRNGGFHLSGYCLAGSGCWSSMQSPVEEKIEIALTLPR